MAENSSKKLDRDDRRKLSGYSDITWTEPDQIYPPTLLLKPEEPPTPAKKADSLKEEASGLLSRINALKEKIDRKCSHLQVATEEGAGSALYQAMWRVFAQRTTTITYDHYKRAIELNQKLAKEDAAELKVK